MKAGELVLRCADMKKVDELLLKPFGLVCSCAPPQLTTQAQLGTVRRDIARVVH